MLAHRRRHPSVRSTRGAFTLLEVLLVLAILVVLASLAVGVFSGAQNTAQKQAAKTDVSMIADAFNLYKLHTGQWPQDFEALKNDPGIAGWSGPYIQKDQFIDPWNQEYVMKGPDQYDSKYVISSNGPPNAPEEIVSSN